MKKLPVPYLCVCIFEGNIAEDKLHCDLEISFSFSLNYVEHIQSYGGRNLN